MDQASLSLIHCEVVALYPNGLDSLDSQDIHTNQTFKKYFTGFRADLYNSLENGDIAYEDINSEIPDPSQCSRSFRHSFSYDGMNLDTISELETEGMELKKLPYLVENRG